MEFVAKEQEVLLSCVKTAAYILMFPRSLRSPRLAKLCTLRIHSCFFRFLCESSLCSLLHTRCLCTLNFFFLNCVTCLGGSFFSLALIFQVSNLLPLRCSPGSLGLMVGCLYSSHFFLQLSLCGLLPRRILF
jgi:hypothetical protein